MKFIDRTGIKVGRLTVLKYDCNKLGAGQQ